MEFSLERIVLGSPSTIFGCERSVVFFLIKLTFVMLITLFLVSI